MGEGGRQFPRAFLHALLEAQVGGAQIAAKVTEQNQQCRGIGDQVDAKTFLFLQDILDFVVEGKGQRIQPRSGGQACDLCGECKLVGFVLEQQHTGVVSLLGFHALTFAEALRRRLQIAQRG